VCYELWRTRTEELAAWADEQPWRFQSRGSRKPVSFMKKQAGCPWRKATRRKGSLHSGAQDITNPAPLESLFLQIQERTSYQIKNIKKKKSCFLSICMSCFRHTNIFMYIHKLKLFPSFGVQVRFSPRSEKKVPYAVLCCLLQHGQLSTYKQCLFSSFNLKFHGYWRDLEHQWALSLSPGLFVCYINGFYWKSCYRVLRSSWVSLRLCALEIEVVE